MSLKCFTYFTNQSNYSNCSQSLQTSSRSTSLQHQCNTQCNNQNCAQKASCKRLMLQPPSWYNNAHDRQNVNSNIGLNQHKQCFHFVSSLIFIFLIIKGKQYLPKRKQILYIRQSLGCTNIILNSPLCQFFNLNHSNDTEGRIFAFCLSLLEKEELPLRLILIAVETWKYFNHFPAVCTLITSPSPQGLISDS